MRDEKIDNSNFFLIKTKKMGSNLNNNGKTVNLSFYLENSEADESSK